MRGLKNQINSVILPISRDFIKNSRNKDHPYTKALSIYYWYNNKKNISKKDIIFAANGISMLLSSFTNAPFYTDVLKLMTHAKSSWSKIIKGDSSKEFFDTFEKYELEIKKITIKDIKNYIVNNM